MTKTPRTGGVATLRLGGSGGQVDSAQGVALLISLLLIDSLHYVFARLLFPHIEPGLGALYVIGIAALEVGVFGLVSGRLRLAPLRRQWRTFAAIGLCVALSTNLNYAAMAYIDPGVAAMVGKTVVLFSLAFGLLLLGERLTLWQGAGAAVALVGLAVISYRPGDYLSLGALMVLVSTFVYALHAVLTKRNMGEVDLLNFFFYRLLLTAAVLALITGARGNLALPTGQALPVLLVTATVDVVISRALYYWTLRQLDMSVFAVVLAVSPLAAIVWSLFLFDTFPSPQQLLGGAGILIGVALVTAAPVLERRRRRADAQSSA